MNLTKNFQILKLSYSVKSFHKRNNAVIAAAVRTPLIQLKEEKPKRAEVIASVIDEIIKRSALPKETVNHVQIINLLPSETELISDLSEQLPKNVQLNAVPNVSTAVLKSIEIIQSQSASNVIISGFDTAAITINDSTLRNFELLKFNHVLQSETMPVNIRENRRITTISEDEIITNGVYKMYTATALALSSLENTSSLNIKPLAHIVDFFDSSCQGKGLEKLKEMAGKQNINAWSILASNSNEVQNLKKLLGLEDQIELKSFVDIFSQLPNIAPLSLLTTLTHLLKPQQKGCVVFGIGDALKTIVVERCCHEVQKNSPKLTLYTMNNCCLCDDLVKELEENFKDEYCLEKVYIDRKENVRFLRLYRHDIPVLFLNGEFLCMHRLNICLLRKKLNEILKNGNI